MDEPAWLTPTELEAWRLLSAVMVMLPRQLEQALEPHGMSLFDYQVMAGLSDAPERSLPMSRLAEWSNGSLSRLSHAVSRMERRGLVARQPWPQDRRVTLVTMTDEGHALMVRAAPDHVASVRAALVDRLDGQQVDHLVQVCRSVLDGIGVAYPPPWES